jgi:hypothetical protein
MAIYLIQGKLGTGKSKFAVRVMQQALLAGRKVASNIDVDLGKLVPTRPRAWFYRLPDKPTAEDLASIGSGNPDSYDEERNGVLVLDELGSWLNARAFADKDRAPVLEWLIHARKHGWDVYFLAQSIQQIDRQVRESLAEYTISCLRLDKVKVPGLGWLGLTLPRMHLAVTRLGQPPNSITIDRDVFRGDDLHACYDTRQIFSSSYPHGAHAVLSAAYLSGEPARAIPLWLWVLNLMLRPVATAAALRSGAAAVRPAAKPVLPPALKPKLAVVERSMSLPPDERVSFLRDLRRHNRFMRALSRPSVTRRAVIDTLRSNGDNPVMQ